jgi:hypothetical protein
MCQSQKFLYKCFFLGFGFECLWALLAGFSLFGTWKEWAGKSLGIWILWMMVLKIKEPVWSLTGGSIKYQRASFDPKPSFKKWRNLTLINDQFLLVISWELSVLWSFSNTQNWRSVWLLKTSKNKAKGCEDLNFLFKTTPELEIVWFLKF